jgi:hypothetical protein
MSFISDYLKAILYPDNLLEYAPIDDNLWNAEKDKCPVIQHFSYKVQRNRNDAGIPYGGTTPTELKFTIRLGQPDDSKLFYDRLMSNELFEYTFIFNATFDDNKRLKSFEDAMVTRGYVVDVKEDFSKVVTEGSAEKDDQEADTASNGQSKTLREKLKNNLSDQILLEVTLLLSSITYVGKEDQNNRKLEITNY